MTTETVCKITRLSDEVFVVCVGHHSVPDFKARDLLQDIFVPGMRASDLADRVVAEAAEPWRIGLQRLLPDVPAPANVRLEFFFLERTEASLAISYRRFEACLDGATLRVEVDRQEWADGAGEYITFPSSSLKPEEAGRILFTGEHPLKEGVVGLVARECESERTDVGWPIDLLVLTKKESKLTRYVRGDEGQPVLEKHKDG